MFLVASSRDSTLSAEAGIKYFVLGAFSTALFLLGVSYIYIYFGSFWIFSH
jgi:NADH-quinone oxidoreductase subunit N